MAKPKLLSTHKLFEAPRKLLDEHFDVDYWERPERPPRAEVLARVADKEALICLLTEKINDELLDAAPKLRIVCNVAVGFDNIDVAACTRRKIVATNTPGVLDETTADFAWTLLMAVARRLVEGDQLTRSGAWAGWNLDQLCGADVWGKTLGLVGFGRIGRAVARRAAGFGMRILYNDAIPVAPEVAQQLNAEFVERDKLFAEADFVSVHVPLLPETRHLISAAQFAKMKKTAYLINTSRGPVVDEAALVAALQTGEIAGAALDVYENEPKVHAGLVGRKDVVLAPHIASASVETRTKMAMMAVENCVARFEGKKPPNALNPEVL
ncbi:MAG: D-glycerate dehydrogenase [Acidobacteria bacterium]|nr:D-glycerate dehydrogenase [Acidobacteriota bacterium]MCL5286648.1 D-glycerate dehydrogenase [Acidobacteriota bacterium]